MAPRGVLITSGVTWSRGETPGIEAGCLVRLPALSGADTAEILLYSLLDFSLHGCKVG